MVRNKFLDDLFGNDFGNNGFSLKSPEKYEVPKIEVFKPEPYVPRPIGGANYVSAPPRPSILDAPRMPPSLVAHANMVARYGHSH